MGTCGCLVNENNNKTDKHVNELKILNKDNPKIKSKIKPDMGKKENENKVEKNDNKLKSELEKRKILNQLKVPMNVVLEAKKSMCKIFNGYRIGTGFFMKIEDSKKYLITVEHVIPKNNDNLIIKLELYNEKMVELNLENRSIGSLKHADMTIIEIKDSDNVSKEIKFLYYDQNYLYGYQIYRDAYVFTLLNTENGLIGVTGQISNINKFEFEHNLQSKPGSGGSPIMLLNQNIDEIPVIGIHVGRNKKKDIKYGSFIGEIDKIIKPKSEICIILFISTDQLINIPIHGNIGDNFRDFEEKLFNHFPDLRNKNIYFLAEGRVVDRDKTLKNNNIKNDTTIIICINDD